MLIISRERNRMHAKMTRDRKKTLMNELEQAVDVLQQEIAKLQSTLNLAKAQPLPPSSSLLPEVTPVTSPELTSMTRPDNKKSNPEQNQQQEQKETPFRKSGNWNDENHIIKECNKKRSIQHGFVLNQG